MKHSAKPECGFYTASVCMLLCGLFMLLICAFSINVQAEDLYTDLDSIVAEESNTEGIKYTERPDDNLLIVGVIVDDTVLDQGFLVYLENEDIIIPLGAFVDLLKFPINVNPETGHAKGWFINEENVFELQPPYKQAQIGQTKYPIAKHEVIENHLDDIYVSKSLIERWFPIKLDFVFQELRIYLRTTEDLPFQSNAKRHALWESIKKQSKISGREKIGKDVMRLPYKKLSFPTIQVSNGIDIKNDKTGSKTTSNHSVNIQGDLLGMNMHGSLGYQHLTNGNNSFQRSSINLSKENFEGNIAGPLHATQLELGDISTYSFPHAPGGSQGRGFKISNAPVNFIRDVNSHVIEGFAPVGWDVEIYQDDRLLNFITIEDDGKYRFDALPLRFGFNLFHIIMYGPNGEKREEFERFYLGNNMIDPGKMIYEVSAIQSSSPLIDLKKTKSEETEPAISVLGEYGINKSLSASMGYYAGPIAGEDELSGLLMGIRGSRKSSFGQFNIFRNHDGARSISLEATGNLNKNTTWNAGHIRHRGYDTNVRNIREESFLGFSKTLSLKKLSKVNYSFNINRQIDNNGIRSLVLSNRTGGNFFGMSLTNSLEYTIRNTSDTDQIIGKLTINKRVPFGTFRGTLNYHLHDKSEIDSINLQLQNNITQKVSVNALLNSVLGDDPKNTLSAGLDIKLEKYRLGLLSSISDQDEKSIGMNLSYNFIPQSLNGDYKISASSSDLSNGHIILKPFIDLNQDGMHTKGEDLLAGIKFKNMLRGSKATTDKNGTAVLSGLVPNAVNKIQLQTDTLPDIYMAPAVKNLKILGKKGVNGPVYVAINQLGEISGTITYINTETNEEEPIEETEVYLLDKNNEVIAEAITEYDGFYAFPSLPMGSYEMFFPTSQALNNYYSGKGTGPRFELSADEPEIIEGDIIISPKTIKFKNLDSDDFSGDSADNLNDTPSTTKAELKFMGLTKPSVYKINPK